MILTPEQTSTAVAIVFLVRAKIPRAAFGALTVPSETIRFRDGFVRVTTEPEWYVLMWVDAQGFPKEVVNRYAALRYAERMAQAVNDAVLRKNPGYVIGAKTT